NVISMTLYDKLNFNFTRDIAPIASIMRFPFVMEVHPSVPAKTVPEFMAYAKANPGKVTMASAGTGSATHLTGELFKMMTGLNILHVPYRGSGPALIDLIGGQVQLMFDTVPGSIEHIRGGRLRALAVTGAARSDVLPDIPTVGDFVTGYESSGWFGVAAPKNTPTKIIDKLNKEINVALTEPRIKARIADLGGTVFAGSPSDFSKLIAEETEKWAKVVKFSGAKPEGCPGRAIFHKARSGNRPREGAAMTSGPQAHQQFVTACLTPGRVGNPGGSLEATRRSFNRDFLLALAADFKKHGAAAIEKVRKQQPAAYMKICALLVPPELQVEHSAGVNAITDEQP